MTCEDENRFLRRLSECCSVQQSEALHFSRGLWGARSAYLSNWPVCEVPRGQIRRCRKAGTYIAWDSRDNVLRTLCDYHGLQVKLSGE